MSRRIRSIIAGLGVVLSLVVVGAVAAMTVQPVVLDLRMTGRQTSAPLRVVLPISAGASGPSTWCANSMISYVER